jgi:glucose-6-phosphate 1-epimerase
MDIVNLRHVSGATVQIYHHGAHITSWTTADGTERLFLSEHAEFKSGSAIRGGVPIIFPQFASLGPLPKHGFARSMTWQLDTASTSPNTAVFSLSPTPETISIWPYRFSARYRVELGSDQLSMELSVRNDDDKEFSFTAALHTYLRVQDINQVSVKGLRGCRYRDSANGNVEAVETTDEIRFAGEVDHVYMSTPATITMREGAQVIECASRGFADTVVWNPGPVLSKKLVDMEDDGYRHMVCVEAAAIATPVTLAPKEQWQGVQKLVVK